jgi:hypothetical protein
MISNSDRVASPHTSDSSYPSDKSDKIKSQTTLRREILFAAFQPGTFTKFHVAELGTRNCERG